MAGTSDCAREICECRTYTLGNPVTGCINSKCPAAKANKYVEMGCVSPKKVVFAAIDSVSLETGEFDSTVQSRGALTSSVKRPFRSGWSKQGNAMLASMGTNSV